MTLFDPAWLIHLGAGIMLLAYFIRDELRLRTMIIVASVIYNFYYYLVPSPPLWDVIVTGFLFIGVNVFVLGQVCLDRTTFRLSEEEKELFRGFETLTPGQFRRILELAEWKVGNAETLTRQGAVPASLFFIFEGTVSVEKGDRRFRLPQGNFVGEVAFVLETPATATTIASPQTRFVEWDSAALRALGKKHAALGNALNALLTRDLANKLSESYRPDDALPADTSAGSA